MGPVPQFTWDELIADLKEALVDEAEGLTAWELCKRAGVVATTNNKDRLRRWANNEVLLGRMVVAGKKREELVGGGHRRVNCYRRVGDAS